MSFGRVTHSERETLRLARMLGRVARGGEVLGLVGALGAGKTRFVQGLARGLGVDAREPVLSPTFALIQEHPGRLRLHHIDLYRLEAEDDLAQIGLDEYYANLQAVSAVEWIDRFTGARPADWLEVRIALACESTRRIDAVAHGSRSQAWLRAWQRALFA